MDFSKIKSRGQKPDPIIDYKILTFSEKGVGRSSFLKVAIGESFDYSLPIDIGLNSYIKQVEINTYKIRLTFWIPLLDEMMQLYHEKTNAVIVFYDLTNTHSLSKKVIDKIDDLYRNVKKTIPILLIGTKLDLEDTITETIEEKIKKFKERFIIIGNICVSAKLNINIEKSLRLLGKFLVEGL